MNHHEEHHHDRQIDAALGLLSRVKPDAGLERRLRARLAEQSRRTGRPRLLRLQRFGLGLAATAAAFAIVTGSVRHSHELTLPPPPVRLGSAEAGVGTASAARIPAQAIPAPARKHGRWERKHFRGRAELKTPPRRSPGVEPALPVEQP
ncbi:hypothetical protein [Acidipila rosea]|uniref:Uncharacterized protein n=1 Tax=Acidipila rosea TaxID=768535 RepID=A0A4R1L7W4_9BACT|nr:hypothetical protein [Acidipila rosea]MBW4027168.1 hypothetical protein [Acidobacteriota bacterium]MBW4045745.1 hypothetical protein [Acidobacteriota bacterium]TCK74326.1 hypothetical protein C7378_1948 [Acidipila rosea]